MLLNDQEITDLSKQGMITPFFEKQVRSIAPEDADPRLPASKVISYGVSSFGYDAILAQDFKIFTDTNCAVMDPKNPSQDAFVDKRVPAGGTLLLPPRGYVLAHTVEMFDIPPDVLMLCVGKSTYARSGVLINVTPGEPKWRGQITLEIGNLLPIPTILYPGEGICQFLFWKGNRPNTTYADRSGKYQDQTGVTICKM